MHQLHLLRHAKSSWDDDADDHQRPLNRRGREAARLIGETLPKAIGELDLVLCSTALRARAGIGARRLRPRRRSYERAFIWRPPKPLHRRTLTRRTAPSWSSVITPAQSCRRARRPCSSGFSTLANGKFPTGVRVRFTVATSWAGSPAATCRLRHREIARRRGPACRFGSTSRQPIVIGRAAASAVSSRRDRRRAGERALDTRD